MYRYHLWTVLVLQMKRIENICSCGIGALVVGRGCRFLSSSFQCIVCNIEDRCSVSEFVLVMTIGWLGGVKLSCYTFPQGDLELKWSLYHARRSFHRHEVGMSWPSETRGMIADEIWYMLVADGGVV